MGSKLGLSYACLYVRYIEEPIRARYTGFIPQLHSAVATIWRSTSIMSNFHPVLQFTSTVSELKLPFLNIKLRINDKVQMSVYYKDTDTHNYLPYLSFQPDHCKRAIPYSQFSDSTGSAPTMTILWTEP